MNRTMKTAVAALVLLAGLAAPAAAQRSAGRGGFGISIEKHGRQRDVSFGIHFGGRAVVECPPARRHVHGDSCRRWVPAHCETVTERVWIPERSQRVWVPPVFNECVDTLGRRHRTIVRAGYWNVVTYPGRWECVTRTVEVPGHWQTVCQR